MTTTPAPTRPVPRPHAPDWLVLALVCTAQFMVILDVSIVNVALPSMRRDLGFSETGLQWVVNAYTLAFAGFLLLGGRAADLYGRRRLFILGLGLFSLASLAGGLAQNGATLVAARAVQGLGGAVLAPATLTILTTTFAEGRARSRALGVWSAVMAAGGAAGALLGGILTDLLSWRWILFVNVPIGVAAIVAGRAFLVESKGDERRSLDLAGTVTLTGGLVALVYAIVRTDVYAWTAWQTLSVLAVAAVLLAASLVIEARLAPHPLLPLGLLRLRGVTGANLVALLLGGALFALFFFLSLYLQNVLGYSPLRAGVAFLPLTAGIVVGSAISARAVNRLGVRPLLAAGPLLAGVGMLWLSRISPTGDYWIHVFGPTVVLALGMGLAFVPLTLAATGGVDPRDAGAASGLINTSRQVGGSIGLAALATVAIDRTKELLAGARPPAPALVASATTSGYAHAFVIAGGVAVAAALAAFVVPARRAPAPQPAREEVPAAA